MAALCMQGQVWSTAGPPLRTFLACNQRCCFAAPLPQCGNLLPEFQSARGLRGMDNWDKGPVQIAQRL